MPGLDEYDGPKADTFAMGKTFIHVYARLTPSAL